MTEYIKYIYLNMLIALKVVIQEKTYDNLFFKVIFFGTKLYLRKQQLNTYFYNDKRK